MPSQLKRFHHSGQTHFVTFCCYRRRTLFLSKASNETFEAALERVRRSYRLYVYGYVIMPEHVHLLLSEPGRETLDVAIKSLKQGVSRRLIGDAEHFWQKRYYDFNIRNRRQFAEKLAIFIATQSGGDCVPFPKTGSGAAFFITPLDTRDVLKLNPNGPPTNGSAPPGAPSFRALGGRAGGPNPSGENAAPHDTAINTRGL